MKKDLPGTTSSSRNNRDADQATNPNLLAQVLNASGLPMTVRDRDLTPLFINQALADFYEYSIKELSTLPLETILLKETKALYENEVLPALEDGSPWEGEYRIRTKTGTIRKVLGLFDPVLNEDGELTHIITILQDGSESTLLRKVLTQAESQLNFLAENTSDCLFRIRLGDGQFEYASSAAYNMTGYASQNFYDTPGLAARLIPNDWKATLGKWWKEFRQGISRYDYEMPLIHRNGSRKWAHLRIKVVKDDADTPVAIEGIITDATDRHRAEQALAAAEKSLAFISDSTSDIFFRMRIPEGTYEYLSPSVERFSGYTLEEYEANPLLIRQIVHPDWEDWFKETWEEFLRGEARPEYEFQYIHKSGEVRWANQRVVVLTDDTGKTIAIEGIATDVTERKRAEEIARTNEERFHFLTDNITDVIWTMDNEYRFTYATPSVERVWGYSVDELLSKTIFDLTTPHSLNMFKKAGETRAAAEAEGNFTHLNMLEMKHIRGDGSHIWVESVVGRMLDNDGRPTGFQGVSRDVTLRRESAAKIAKSEARFRTLFEDSPISLWEEDLTRLKTYFDELKGQGITDFRKYFYDTPEDLAHCATLVDVVDVNKATLDLLGARSKEELFGNLDKVLTESSMAAFTEEMILLASGGCEYCGEITHRTLDGDTIWVVVHFFVPPEYEDTLSRVIVSLLDVTPRKKAEEALMDSEERYRVLAENAQEGVVVFQDNAIRYINESMSNIFEFEPERLEELNPLEALHPEDKEQVLQQLEGLLSGRDKDGFASFRIVTGKGRVKWLTLTVKPIMWGGREAQLEILTDVTHHKALEEELLTAHAQMEDRIRKRTAELSEANSQLKAEADERTKAQERILSLTQQLIRIQEDERQRISRDLHDNVAQDLSTIMLRMEPLFDDLSVVDSELRQRGEGVTEILRKAIASVRDIAYGLRPPALDQLGLERALENLCQEVASKSGFDVDFFATGIEGVIMDFDTEINIYRMVQEAVRNISKHARATRATVRMVKSHPDILIRIEDNGRGFDLDEKMTRAVDEKRMGMQGMEERARLIGGTMEIQSLAGTGTRIVFKVPIENARRHM